MFARVFKYTVIASVVASFAVARPATASGGSSQCDNSGALQCCKQVVNSTNTQGQDLGGLLGLLGLGNILGDIGLNCLPINVLGIGNAANCEQQAVCCNDVTQSGLINFGCSPVNLNL